MQLFSYGIALPIITNCAAEMTEPDAIMDRIEAQIQLPEGAADLSEYVRHYLPLESGSVYGIYEISDAPVRRHWVEESSELPLILDGGCSILSIRYDPDTDEISAVCNGRA